MTAIGDSFSFTLDTPPASKKNGREWVMCGSRLKLLPSTKARVSELDVARAAREACGGVMPFGPDDAVRIEYVHDLGTDRVTVTVTKVGQIPKRNRGTKRDLHGMVETIADGLQKVLFPNDNQVDELIAVRSRSAG